MGIDRLTDDPDVRDAPVRHEAPRPHDAPHQPEGSELGKAVGELASESAELYKKVSDLTEGLKTEKARFAAWAKESVRNREAAAQDKAETSERLDKALAVNEALADRVADLERRLTDSSPASGAGAPERRIGEPESVGRQTEKKQSRRLKVSNEAISVGTMGLSTAATVAADAFGSAAAGDAVGIGGSALGLVAAVIALSRKRKEDRDEHRTEG